MRVLPPLRLMREFYVLAAYEVFVSSRVPVQSPNEGRSPDSRAAQPAGRSHRLTSVGIAAATDALCLASVVVKLNQYQNLHADDK